jgi:hypothetical protein
METINPNFKIKKSFSYSGGDQNGEPIGIHILRSGWESPTLYHVLIEFGDFEKTDHHLLTKEQIKEKWNIEFEDLIDLGNLIKSIPNDMELGKSIRLEYIKNQK